jgi:hypothetical protein
MSAAISEEDHRVYRAIADALLPATGQLPAASAAGVADEKLDQILSWRPDLRNDWIRGVRASGDLPPGDAIKRLETHDRPAYEAIRLTALGAYFLDPAVMAALSYSGQESRLVPPEEQPDYEATGLLEPVRARGQVWRREDAKSDRHIKTEKPAMKRHVFLAFTNPAPGREANYNDWQDNEHLPHGLNNPGFVAATRYKLAEAQFGPGEGRSQYVTIWEIESDDIAATLAQATDRQKTAIFTDALDFSTIQTAVYTKLDKPE